MKPKTKLFLPVWIRLMTKLDRYNKPQYKLARDCNVCWSTVSNEIKKLKEKNLITVDRKGSSNEIKLTEQGKDLLLSCIKLTNFIEQE